MGFVPVMVYILFPSMIVDVPEMSPDEVLKSSPGEREGLIENPLAMVVVDWRYRRS